MSIQQRYEIRSSKQPKPQRTPLKVVVDREQRIVLEEIARALVYRTETWRGHARF
jgi:hypothetical protein